jgi:hypothetical protein
MATATASFEDVYDRLHKKLKKTGAINDIVDDFEILDKDDQLEDILDEYEYTIINYIKEDNIDSYLDSIHYDIDNKNNVVAFDQEEYMREILKSYQYNVNKILDQFEVDFPRNRVYYNNRRYKNENYLKYEFAKFDGLIFEMDGHSFDFLIILELLCNQSSYAFPYLLMHKLYSDESDSLMVAGLHSGRKIKINTDNGILSISMKAEFGLKKLPSGRIMSKLRINQVIGTNLVVNKEGNFSLKDRSKNIFTDYGMLYWSKYNRKVKK